MPEVRKLIFSILQMLRSLDFRVWFRQDHNIDDNFFTHNLLTLLYEEGVEFPRLTHLVTDQFIKVQDIAQGDAFSSLVHLKTYHERYTLSQEEARVCG